VPPDFTAIYESDGPGFKPQSELGQPNRTLIGRYKFVTKETVSIFVLLLVKKQNRRSVEAAANEFFVQS
jgi:hypothetical protein